MVKIYFYSANPESPPSGYWDQALIEDLLQSPQFTNMAASKDGAVVVIPGKEQAAYIDQINKYLNQYTWVLLFITSDEESNFPIEKITHKNFKAWIQYPKQGRHDDYGKLPLGYITETRKNLSFGEKPLNVFYAGQKTHDRRVQCSQQLKLLKQDTDNVVVIDTAGFAKGVSPIDYMYNMCNARVAPAPAGPVSADSFRTYEALEAGAVPIVDQISQAGDFAYSFYLFDNPPFPALYNYDDLPGYTRDALKDYPHLNNEVQAWWIRTKRNLIFQFLADIQSLTQAEYNEPVTVLIPVSPIPSHPSIEILEETVKSVRFHLPTAEIIITFDGVRDEQAQMKADYYEFIRRALFHCNTDWNAIPLIFPEHTHQVGMAREALKMVNTPLILYVEQDTPLVTDEPIEWDDLISAIYAEKANVIRLHFEAVIPKEHKDLMLGEPEDGLLKTIQWSNRPHLADTAFYKYMLRTHFSDNAKCFIEDKIHGAIQRDCYDMGMRGWDLWKLFIYYPNDKNIKRSLNLDGRAGGEKYDDTQEF